MKAHKLRGAKARRRRPLPIAETLGPCLAQFCRCCRYETCFPTFHPETSLCLAWILRSLCQFDVLRFGSAVGVRLARQLECGGYCWVFLRSVYRRHRKAFPVVLLEVFGWAFSLLRCISAGRHPVSVCAHHIGIGRATDSSYGMDCRTPWLVCRRGDFI